MIQAIPTTYRSIEMRSRAECRWAMLLDLVGIEWEYESEGIQTELGGGRYLPDFYLPTPRVWVEVKGCLDTVSDEKLWTMATVAGEGYPILFLMDFPGLDASIQGTPSHYLFAEDGIRQSYFIPGGIKKGKLIQDYAINPRPLLATPPPNLPSLFNPIIAASYRRARNFRFQFAKTKKGGA
jgi:hypothetical protein